MFLLDSFALAACCLFLSITCVKLSRGQLTSCAPQWPRKPIIPGIAIGIPSLAWSAYAGCLMLEGNLTKFHTLVWLLVPVTTVLSILYLDYLNARAFGGFFTLSANFLISQGFVHDVPLRPLFSLVCLFLGILGMISLGLPWRTRDAFELAGKRKDFAVATATFFAFSAFILILFPCLARH